jgi:hypothetical protein
VFILHRSVYLVTDRTTYRYATIRSEPCHSMGEADRSALNGKNSEVFEQTNSQFDRKSVTHCPLASPHNILYGYSSPNDF